jgi:hypothetical protein
MSIGDDERSRRLFAMCMNMCFISVCNVYEYVFYLCLQCVWICVSSLFAICNMYEYVFHLCLQLMDFSLEYMKRRCITLYSTQILLTSYDYFLPRLLGLDVGGVKERKKNMVKLEWCSFHMFTFCTYTGGTLNCGVWIENTYNLVNKKFSTLDDSTYCY